MTLAAILLIYIFCLAPSSVLASTSLFLHSVEQQAPPAKPPESSAPQGQNNAPGSQTQNPPPSPATSPSASPASQTSGQKPSATSRRKRRHKKAAGDKKPAVLSDCTSSTGAVGDAPADPSAANDPTGGAGTPAPSHCPPPKTVVREGGTSEPSIQLTGDAGGDPSSHQRSTTDQLLGSAENNLKKIAGRQLNSSQQAMVNQIQQFMEQSKAAVAAGDVQRGHNLALKALLLSDELTKP